MIKFSRQYSYNNLGLLLIQIFLCLTFSAGDIFAQNAIEFVMPFPSDTQVRCSQGPGNDFSHTGFNTANDLDFAAIEGTQVVASADGIVHVFNDIPDQSFQPPGCTAATSGGFGNHVNIDHGDGFFSVYAHLRTIEPGIDGQAIVAGKPIGTVNTTGYSCGNHLHFGLHKGDPSRPGTDSESVPITNIFTREVSGGAPMFLAGNDFICGHRGEGRTYEAVELTPPQPVAALAYIPSLVEDTVYVIDTATDVVIGDPIPVGLSPNGVAGHPDGSKVYITNSQSNNVSIIRTSTNTVIGTVMVGGSPFGVAVSAAGTFAYVANTGSGTVSVINTQTHAVLNPPIAVDGQPYLVAAHPSEPKVYVTIFDRNRVLEIDTIAHTIVDILPTGDGPVGITVHPMGSFVYVVNLTGTSLSVINTSTRASVEVSLSGGRGKTNAAVHPDGSKVYIAGQGFFQNPPAERGLNIVDTATLSERFIPLPRGNPLGVSVTPAGTKIYVPNDIDDAVYVVDAISEEIINLIDTGRRSIAFGNFIVPVPSN